MKKRTIIAILGVLVVIIGITAYLNLEGLAEKQELAEEARFMVTFGDGERNITFEMADIRELGEIEFTAILRGGGRPGREYTFTGVPLRNLLAEIDDVNLADVDMFVVRSVDGFTVAFTYAEIMAEDNVYIVYKRNGEPLGIRAERGTGPYRIVVRQDPFAMRWARYAVELELKMK
ncbi:MAG: molybdopterin-dependent oxidoreductase [Methanophagales archaeon]|nr:molybdopterin-dependent oxidoreductase [Methanophagales archaeon]